MKKLTKKQKAVIGVGFGFAGLGLISLGMYKLNKEQRLLEEETERMEEQKPQYNLRNRLRIFESVPSHERIKPTIMPTRMPTTTGRFRVSETHGNGVRRVGKRLRTSGDIYPTTPIRTSGNITQLPLRKLEKNYNLQIP